MRCIKCNDYVDWRCKKCHFTGIGYSAVCDECITGYYLDTYKTCSSSRYEDDYVSPGSCPSNCDACKYNDEDGSTECYKCSSKYALNSEKECIYCGPYCKYCNIDKNNNPICVTCESGYKLIDNKCWLCPSNCDQCILNEYKNETICTSCSYKSFFDKEKKNCISIMNQKKNMNAYLVIRIIIMIIMIMHLFKILFNVYQTKIQTKQDYMVVSQLNILKIQKPINALIAKIILLQ